MKKTDDQATITVRRAGERGHFDFGWLDTYHTFSFGDYHDPEHMGFRALRVINEDRVQPGAGFPTHPHRDMEIITYVLSGALAHEDSMRNGSTIRPGDVQRMTAGTGVTHSERNPSETAPVHLLQIWILPEKRGLAPSYEQRAFSDIEKRARWRLIAARDGRDGAVTVHQDVSLFAAVLGRGQELGYGLAPGRHAWLQVARGKVTLDGHALAAGDGCSANGGELVLRAPAGAEVLLFDLA